MAARDEESRRRIRQLLRSPKWRDRSARAIAAHLQISEHVVRSEAKLPTLRTVRNRYGRVGTMDVAKIGMKSARWVRLRVDELRKLLAGLPRHARRKLLEALHPAERGRVTSRVRSEK